MKKKVLLSLFVLLLVITGLTVTNKVYAAGEEKTGKFVHWKGGSTWSYYTVGDFEVNSLTLDDINLDGRRVYCCEHEKRTPQDTTSSEYPSLTAKIYYPDTPGYDARVATILYYGPGGEGQRWTLNNESLVATSMALNYCFTGDRRPGTSIGNNAIFQELLRLAEEEPLDTISYVLFQPEYSNFQITAAYVGIANPTGTVEVIKKDNHGQPKAGAEFRLYNSSESFTATTGNDGKATFTEVPVGDYTIEETKAPQGMYNNPANKTASLTVNADTTTTYSKENTYPTITIGLKKFNADNRTAVLGDSTLAGAEFELRAAEEIKEGTTIMYAQDALVHTFVTDENGECEAVTGLPIGSYYLTETKASAGYMLNENRYDTSFSYIDENTPVVGTYIFEVPEDAIYGAVEVFKFENIAENVEKSPAEGVVLRLTLQDDENEYYEAVVDEYGYAEFINQEVRDLGYDCTIPYGTYTLEEVAGPDGNKYYFIQPVTINIEEQNQVEYKIVSDNPVPVWLRVIKKDINTGETVPLPGAEFEIYTTDGEKVLMRVAGSGNEISTFVTNEDGEFYTPRQLYPGEYVIYETKAPEGFYLQDEWRKPENSADYGNPEKGGKYIKIDKLTAGLEGDAVYPLGGVEAGEIVYEADMPDDYLYVNLLIEKTAERLTGATQSTVTYVGAQGKEVEVEKVTPVYTDNIGLKDVKYKIYANEDIYKPNGDIFAQNGDLVDDITTDENGKGQSIDLLPGEYKVVEYEVPEGYLLDTTPTIVQLENEDQLVKSKTTKLELNDERQKLSLKFEKEFAQSKYTTGEETKYAVFGIFTKDPISDYKGNETIPSDALVELLTINDNGIVESTADLPQGDYVVKELFAEFPYEANTQTQTLSLRYNNDGVTEKVVTEGTKVVNNIESGKIKFIKLSTTANDNVVVIGNNISREGLDEKAQEIIEELKNKTDEQIEQYFQDNPIRTVSGAKYEIWLDAQGTKKVYETKENGQKEVAVFETNGYGAIKIEELPIGKFYLKEVEAPKGYEVSDELVEFELTKSNDSTNLYQAIFDDSSRKEFLHKTDLFTGEDVPNCTFEITDEDGNLILKSVTGEDGLAWIPNDAFIPYIDKPETKFYYTEIDAPDVYKEDGKLYKLNTEPHEFTVDYDEETKIFTTEHFEVENLRPTTNVKFVKTDEEGNLVPDCKFELKSEEEGLYYETGVTDENGIYVFENVPQGWYTYTELEAPEEYDLDTTPHRVYVTGDEMIIDFVNTGDIPVVAISSLALVSVLGIGYITTKRIKLAKSIK